MNHQCVTCGKDFDTGQKLGAHIAFVHKRDQKLLNESRPNDIVEVTKITRLCERCNKPFEVKRYIKRNGSYRDKHNRFCSRGCANVHVFTEEQNKSKGRKKEKVLFDHECANCKTLFKSKRKNQKCCNRSCAMSYRNCLPQNREKWLSICSKPTSHKAMHGIVGVRKDVHQTIKFKSSWEADFARILNYEKLNWQYEPKTFKLSDGRHYTPDFYVNDIYIEIKNFLTTNDKNRHEVFLHDYPNKLVLVCGCHVFYAIVMQYIDINSIRFESERKAKRQKDCDFETAKSILERLKNA